MTPDHAPSQFERSTIHAADAEEVRISDARGAQRSRRVPGSGRQLPRRDQAVERRIRRLAGGGILARRLAEVGRRALDVQDVVDDLECQAELAAARSIASISALGAAPMTAPALPRRESAPRSSSRACASRRRRRAAVGSRGEGVTHARSIAWPPTMPAGPAAAAMVRSRAPFARGAAGRHPRLTRDR